MKTVSTYTKDIIAYSLVCTFMRSENEALTVICSAPDLRRGAAKRDMSVPRLPSTAPAEGDEACLTRAMKHTLLAEEIKEKAGLINTLTRSVLTGEKDMATAKEEIRKAAADEVSLQAKAEKLFLSKTDAR